MQQSDDPRDAREHGAGAAGYVLLRLPNELRQVWRDWLELRYLQRATHVMSLVQQMHGGRDYGLLPEINESAFIRPRAPSPQGRLL